MKRCACCATFRMAPVPRLSSRGSGRTRRSAERLRADRGLVLPLGAARASHIDEIPRMKLLRESTVAAECERCGVRFDPVTGGVCSVCRRILCDAHLNGSFFRRARTCFGAAPACVYCAAAAPTEGAITDATRRPEG